MIKRGDESVYKLRYIPFGMPDINQIHQVKDVSFNGRRIIRQEFPLTQ